MLQASHGTACARFTISDKGHMSQFGTAVGKTVEQFTVDNHCAADTGSYGQEHDILCTLSGTVHRFSQPHQVGVIAHLYRQAGFRFNAVGKIQILPTLDVLGSTQYYAVRFVHNTGSTYTYTFYRYSELQGRSHHLFAGGYQLTDYRFRGYQTLSAQIGELQAHCPSR